jgi:hypothetical protein
MNILVLDFQIIIYKWINKLTGIQWQLKVNLDTSSHIPARHGFGSHGFVQFCRWISE